MRKSLFALENADGMDAGEEMEVSVEEGEVASVGVDTEDEIGEINDVADAVSDGTDAAAQMGEVEDLVEDAVENGDGLDPVAAEAVRISVEAICARIGANPKAVYSLYATENFASASSRRANSRIALEGIGEFLKDLWKRIKAALTNMWKKVKDFWAKHLSSLGRVKKALEAAKVKVNASSGNFKQGGSNVDKAPSGLAADFGGKGTLTGTRVAEYITSQATLLASASTISGVITTVSSMSENTTGDNVAAAMTALKKGDNDGIKVVGGETLKITVESSSDDKKLEINVDRTAIDDVETDVSMTVPGKTELLKYITDTITAINATITQAKTNDKNEKVTNDALNKVQKVINDAPATGDGAITADAKAVIQTNLSLLYKLNSVAAKVQGIIASQNVRLARAVISFCMFSIKQYKPK